MDTLSQDDSNRAAAAETGGEVVVLRPGDERAQKIGKAIASQSANDILHALREHSRTAGDLTSFLGMPMGTVKYHLENLLEAGLIEVRETRYSVKGREIKVYGLRDQLLIVAPAIQNIRSILLKYATLFAIIILASLAAHAMMPVLTPPPGMAGGSGESASQAAGDISTFQAEKNIGPLAEPAIRMGHEVMQGVPFDPVLAFFIGGCLVILILLLYEVALWRRLK